MNWSITNEDAIFQQCIEEARFSAEDFDHRAHLRLAYIYLANYRNVSQANLAVEKALIGLLKAAAIDPAVKYHQTLTTAWLMAVWHFMNSSGNTESANEFIDKNSKLLNSKIMLSHYTEERLYSDESRRTFVAPDLEPIPVYT